MKRIVISLCFFFLCIISIDAQEKAEIQITDVKVKGTNILVLYEIKLNSYQWCDVELLLSCDGGKTYGNNFLRAVSGDIGRIKSSGSKQVIWRTADEQNALTGEDLVFKIKIINHKYAVKGKTFILADVGADIHYLNNFSANNLDYGVMAGWSKRVGGYIKFKSDFISFRPDFDCNSDGSVVGVETEIWTTGKSKQSRLFFTGGLTVYAAKFLYFHIGIGYGKRTLAWNTIDDKWARVKDLSYYGIAADAGAIINIGMFSISLGATTIMGKYFEPEIGIGIMF